MNLSSLRGCIESEGEIVTIDGAQAQEENDAHINSLRQGQLAIAHLSQMNILHITDLLRETGSGLKT